jgi:hypothetical protein
MARLNEDAQWIVLMGFMVSFSLIFLGIVINQSVLVGQTTAEGVLEFPKNDIKDIRAQILSLTDTDKNKVDGDATIEAMRGDLYSLSMYKKNAVTSFKIACWREDTDCKQKLINIHYNNGVTAYNETVITS